MNTKEKIKQYLDANVHDGEDRKGCHCDKAVFSPDELQELVEEACEYALKEEKGQAKSYAGEAVVVSKNGLNVFRICSHCNQEYQLVMGKSDFHNFSSCAHCKERNDVWIRVEIKGEKDNE